MLELQTQAATERFNEWSVNQSAGDTGSREKKLP